MVKTLNIKPFKLAFKALLHIVQPHRAWLVRCINKLVEKHMK